MSNIRTDPMKPIGMDAVRAAYRPGEEVDNQTLYERVRDNTGVERQEWERKQPIGVSGQEHSLAARKARWHQQTLRRLGAKINTDDLDVLREWLKNTRPSSQG